MNKRRIALIDLGTNTFHLLITEIDYFGRSNVLLRLKLPVKLGRGGISTGRIAPDAYERAMVTLQTFKEKIAEYRVTDVKALATSAMRNAANGPELAEDIRTKIGFDIEIISGDREAELIYYGVRSAMDLGYEKNLIIDIGGGSVEFIICNRDTVFWKRSFEIGAQRLLDHFFKHDPIPENEIAAEREFLLHKLAPLAEAVQEFQPKILVGSSGTFDTLCDIEAWKHGINRLDNPSSEADLPLEAFYRMYYEILPMNHAQRLAIPGMIEMRADMIVVALILIDFVIREFQIERVRVSAYALKEGMLQQLLAQKTPV
jgi:exopolyphosphatase / guanosine-5'-triphosphate,3'-diphosphate pyrophosphatase